MFITKNTIFDQLNISENSSEFSLKNGGWEVKNLVIVIAI